MGVVAGARPQVITRESAEADKVKQVVSKEEAIASEEASNVKAIKDDCEADLKVAMPLLEVRWEGAGGQGGVGQGSELAVVR